MHHYTKINRGSKPFVRKRMERESMEMNDDRKKLREWVRGKIFIPDGKLRRCTDAFGQISFKGATRAAHAKYIRIGADCEASTIYKLLIDGWQLEQPCLLVSVTGGAKSFSLDPELEKQFATGLVKVAKTPGAWVLTGGTNTGVMKHVGAALQGVTNSLIGISTWGMIQNRNNLNSGELGSEAEYTVACSLTEKGAFLDHNHTQHILVDDGLERFGAEIPFRSKLEEHLTRQNTPAVLLVVEGGVGTLDTVCESISKQPPIPVVIIEGSGRVADLLAYAYIHVDESFVDDLDASGGKNDLYDQIEQILPEITDEGRKRKTYYKLIECMQRRNYVTLFVMSEEKGIDEAILTGLLKSKMYNKELQAEEAFSIYKQLQFIILWNRADLAKSYFSKAQGDWYGKEKELAYLVIMALALNRVDFVKLFIGYGVNMQSILTPEVLEFLYGFRSHHVTSLLDEALDHSNYTPAAGACVEIMRTLCNFEKINYDRCSVSLEAVETVLKKILRIFMMTNDDRFIEGPASVSQFEYPFKELFIFALLNNMHEMALYFWSFEEECLAKAFFGIEINRYMADLSVLHDLPGNITSGLNENALEFRDLCTNLLDECYSTDRVKTDILLTSSSRFNQQSALTLAVLSEHKPFVSHNAVQVLLNDIWTGAIKETEISRFRLLAAFILPPLICLFRFHKKEAGKLLIQQAEVNESYENLEQPTYQYSKGQDELSREGTDERPTSLFTSVTRGFENKKDDQISPVNKVLYFYFKTPVVQFLSNLIAYVVFLLLFGYVSMTGEKGSLSVAEWVLFLFVISMAIEEVRQVIHEDSLTLPGKVTSWWDSHWNKLDLAALITYFVTFSFRIHALEYAQPLYAVNSIMWIIRLLNVFYADQSLGPYVVMIFQMFKDMLNFLIILAVFLFAYGISSASVLTPQSNGFRMLVNTIFRPYFNIYGELFIDRDPEDASTTRFGTPVLNSYSEPLAWILLGFYLLVANVLLLNLLIAIFNNTYERVQNSAEEIWKFQRYELIMEYVNRPPLVPPFILLCHVYQLAKFIMRSCRGGLLQPKVHMRKSVDGEEKLVLMEFESECKFNLLRQGEEMGRNT